MKYLSFVISSLILFSCNHQPELNQSASGAINKDSLLQVIMNVDKSWSDSSLKKGFYKSRIDFADDEAINLLDKKMPLIGKNAMIEYANSNSDSTFSLQWNPLKAEVALSGDLGSTFGGWILKTKTKSGADTTLYGDYITVWKKQADNSWKFILDGGNDTPREVK